MNVDTPLFVFTLFDSGSLLFLSVYVIVTLSDLECDHLNAKQCCVKLNKWVIPEIIALLILPILLFVTGHWYLFALNLPMIFWLILKYQSTPKGNIGLYDPTEIHNYRRLKEHFRDTLIKLAYNLLMFCVYLYCLIISLLTNN
ncbi:cornichon-like protein [Leptotrombidium deliense]|uniref:Cornichon-like protein n=1 Tax=Leptotrombidium deliense TaxID=299467 RepID=A0A443SFE1_9ACAR|nr:cornichon-like protein [Leptotrombidium deliense]